MAEPLLRGLTLKGLEVFEAIARTGSVAATAEHLGMSAPAVSQQLKNLAQALGTELVDHSRRPMTLTPAGRLFLARTQTALAALRTGQRGLVTLDLSDVSALSVGVIEDFENEVTPRLAAHLAEAMSQCVFRLQTGASHDLHTQLARRDLDIAICAAGAPGPPGAVVYPLVDDPYILAVPRGRDMSDGLGALGDLAFLRRPADQVMGRQIEGYLSRSGLSLEHRFEIDSNQSLSALVAGGNGWTITTILSVLRAGRFADGIDTLPLPGRDMARRIVLYATNDWVGTVPEQIAALAKDLIAEHFVTVAQTRMPHLPHGLRLVEDGAA